MGLRAPAPLAPKEDPGIARGSILVYRTFDLAEEIDLARVESLLQRGTGESRLRLARTGRYAVVMRNPPVRINLGETRIELHGETFAAETLATIWDYGVLSLMFQIPIAAGTRWNELIAKSAILNGDVPGAEALDSVSRKRSQELADYLRSAFTGPSEWPVFEDYVIYFIESFQSDTPHGLQGLMIPELILGEPQDVLSSRNRVPILENIFQYAENDLVAIDWNSAIVIEPSGQRDIPDVIEFALSHLLEFRYYDDLLDRRLAALYDSIGQQRRRPWSGIWPGVWQSPYAKLSREANARFLEFSEFIERIDNSLKVVGDFYIAGIYRSAIRRFRIPDWQQSITRKMNLLARVSELLLGQVNVHRGHTLELVIILLITFEIISALVRSTH